MDLDWARLAEALATGRSRAGYTQHAAAEALGVARATIQNLEDPGRRWNRVTQNQRAAARLYGWTDDSIGRVLDGGDPEIQTGPRTSAPAEPAATPAEANLASLPHGTPQRVRKALTGGEAIDTELIPIGDDPESGLVMVIKQGDGQEMSQEHMEWVMRRWVKLTEIAREIYRKDPPPDGGNP